MDTPMKGLLDADFMVYRGCFSKSKKDFIQILDSMDWCINDLISTLNLSECRIFLTGGGNFRYSVYSDYKKDRPAERPEYYHEIRDYLIKEWNAELSYGFEADDLCGLNQSDDTIIIGEDKDLLTIPGWHYRVAKKWEGNSKVFITEEEAARYFFQQCLTGDKIDSIPGLPNPAKSHFKNPPCFTEGTASEILEGLSPSEMKERVQELYQEVYGENWFKEYDLRCRLLFLRRKGCKEYFEMY